MLIGIDVGGTKNELVLSENDGRVIRHLIRPGSNASEYGPEEASARVVNQVLELIEGIDGIAIDAMYAGMAGGTVPKTRAVVRERLKERLPFIKIIDNGSDALNGLYACFGVRDGMVVIAGTGTSAFVRSGDELFQVGGWGYLVDDAGGGYALGRGVLNAAYRDYDHRGEKTSLTDMVVKKAGMSLRDAIGPIYAGGKRYVASFALLAFEAAEAGDQIALSLVETTCEELALLIRTCARYLDTPPYAVAATGSIWKNERLRSNVAEKLGREYRLERADLPPVFGAVVAAASMAGFDSGNRFHDTFKASFDMTLHSSG